MIVFCKKLMPFVLKVSCDSNWGIEIDSHIEESFRELKSIMHDSKYQFILLWVLNENLPSFSVIIKIVGKLVLLYNELNMSIDFNIIYCTNQDTLKLVEKILTLYTPSRPIKIARTNEDVLRYINQ